MYILAIVILYGIMCSPLCAMQEEHKPLLSGQQQLSIQQDADDLESGLSDTSSFSYPSNTSSTGSLPTIKIDRTALANESPTLTQILDNIRIENQRKLNQLQTDIHVLNTSVQSHQAQLTLLTTQLGVLKGKIDFLRGGKGCSMITTSACFVGLWVMFGITYLGWSISL